MTYMHAGAEVKGGLAYVRRPRVMIRALLWVSHDQITDLSVVPIHDPDLALPTWI